MPYVAKLVGERFGRLTVIERAGTHKFGFAIWRCRCDCGNETTTTTGSLRSGHTSSCGCWAREVRRIPAAEWILKEHYRKYRETAQSKGRAFDLTLEQFRAMTDAPCYYCGRVKTKLMKRTNSLGNAYERACNGLDRFDNDKGYTMENSVPCCEDCNRAKLRMTAQQYIDLCHLVAVRHDATQEAGLDEQDNTAPLVRAS